MTPTFFQNSKRFENNFSIKVAVLNLSMDGYLVLEVHDKGEVASIKIDKPYADAKDVVVQDVGTKRYGSCIKYDCRIYWEVADE